MQKCQRKLGVLVEKMKDEAVCCIPQYYWDYANMIDWYLKNKRAHNLTEAINLLEREKRELEMLKYQKRQAEAAELSAYYAEEAAYYAEVTAANTEAAAESARDAAFAAGVGAMFSALDYYKE